MGSSRRTQGAGAGLIVGLLVTLVARHTGAQNREIVSNGPDAALTDGTVVATAESGSAIWYNPAGLVSINAGSFDFSGSVYAMQVAPTRDVLTLEGGESGSGRALNFRVVPRALSFSIDLREDVTLAAGVFHSALGDQAVRVQAEVDDGSGSWAVSNATDGYALHMAVAIGWELRKDLSFGWALDGVYASASSVSIVGSETNLATDDTYEMAYHADIYGWGPQVRAGVRYEPLPGYRIAGTIASPTLAFYEGLQELKTHSGPGDGRELSPQPVGTVDRAGGAFDQLEPGRVRVGLARMWDVGWIALDGDLRLPMHSDVVYDSSWGGTVRLGGIRSVRPRVRLGGALFAVIDRDPPLETLGHESLDYYGVNLGVDVAKRKFELVANGEFSIALAINYSYGVGARAGMLAPDDPTSGPPELQNHRVHAHDLSLNLALRASR